MTPPNDWTELDEEKHTLADSLKSIAFNDSALFMRLIGQMVELHVSQKIEDAEVDADTLLDSQREEIKRLGAEAVELESEIRGSHQSIARLIASLALSKERIEELEMRLAEVDRG